MMLPAVVNGLSQSNMEKLNIPKREKIQSPSSLLERHIRRVIPSLEDYIVRKTSADKRRAIFGKDPFYG